MNIDGAATLRVWSVDVDVGGNTYTIPARPASEWLLAVATGSNLDVVPGLLEDPAALDDALAAGDLAADCMNAARAAITAAAGCPWWTAARLARAVGDTWIGGELTLKGVDPARMSFGAYLAAVYRLATRYLDEAKKARLDAELDQPPMDLPVEQWWDEDAAAAGFEAAAARFG